MARRICRRSSSSLATDYINALQNRAFGIKDVLENVFSQVDAIHTPVLPMPTPTLDQTAYQDGPAYLQMVVSLTRNTRPINFLGLPALSVPCGYTPDGMPTAFQLVGRPFSESILFRLAQSAVEPQPPECSYPPSPHGRLRNPDQLRPPCSREHPDRP
jgi:Asp-tRNA(Asn)/Glu-tRNA(Gln) amidotransferase A subunit family amidase